MRHWLFLLTVGHVYMPIHGYDDYGRQLHAVYRTFKGCESEARRWRKELGEAAVDFDFDCVSWAKWNGR